MKFYDRLLLNITKASMTPSAAVVAVATVAAMAAVAVAAMVAVMLQVLITRHREIASA